MSFKSFLTGHSDKEADVYANLDMVDLALEQLHSISTTTVSNAKDNVYEAIRKLNNVKGMAEQVGTIQTSGYDAMFQSITDSIKDIELTLTDKVEMIKAYSDDSASATGKKVLSTLAMTVFKPLEGFVSVLEGMGDSVLSVVGWVGGLANNSKLQDKIASWVKKDLSHDLFNFYYNSNLAKYSAFTEDSALASATKVVGKTAGFIFAGGGIAGVLSGFGHGVESGLRSGKSYNGAMRQGVASAAINGALGAVGGTIGAIGKAAASEFQSLRVNDDATDIVHDLTSGKIDEYSNAAKGGIFKEEQTPTITPSYTVTYTPTATLTPTATFTPTYTPTYTPVSSIPSDGGSQPMPDYNYTPVPTYSSTPIPTYAPVESIISTPSIIPSSTYTPVITPIVTPVVTVDSQPFVITKEVEVTKPIDATNETPIVEHSGVSYNPTEGLQVSTKTSNELMNAENLMELDELEEMSENDFGTSSLDSVINGSKLTKIPTSTTPTSPKKRGGSSVIPIAAGLSAAAAAAIGAKAYLDHKNNNDFDEEEDEDDSFEDDEWYDDGDTVDVEYTEADKTDDLDQESYQDNSDNTYSARSHDELADLE